MIFYRFIPLKYVSVNYVVKQANQLCTGNEIIDNEDECKLAIRQLNLSFVRTWSVSTFPKGCWNYKIGGTSYWNPTSTGAAHSVCKPICKKGELFELFITNLLYA